ncbi:trehalase-like domain-containing protein [Kitasatospora sp. NPDC006697]|uniref:trehalase-like domain-containing protein n=1 Tax=Kitasatospora sp. NPDC006697 TaxID=3364020 RepID=UPI0036B460E8
MTGHYPPIADHGLIGDLQTCALVSAAGSLDWFCSPRFDSPSVFAALLDAERGGHFTITAEAPGSTVHQLYLADSAILVTRFLTADGVGEVIDCMPIDRPTDPSSRHRILRGIRVVRGSVTFTMECRPRFDYGRRPHELDLDSQGMARFHGAGLAGYLQAVGPVSLERDGQDATARITLHAGELACCSPWTTPRPSRPIRWTGRG